MERLECHLQIDHDFVVTAVLRSTGRAGETREEFHDLDFALALPTPAPSGGETIKGRPDLRTLGGVVPVGSARSNVAQRSNIVQDARDAASHDDLWRLVPGDIVGRWRPDHFDSRSSNASTQQNEERNFYVPCSRCGRRISQITAEGPVEECRGRPCGKTMIVTSRAI